MVVGSLVDIDARSLHAGSGFIPEDARLIFQYGTLFTKPASTSRYAKGTIEAIQEEFSFHGYGVILKVPNVPADLHPLGPLHVKENSPAITIKKLSCLLWSR